MTIRVLLADSHSGIRESMRAIIDRQPNMAVVAEAQDGRSALRLVRDFNPDVVVMDINMADLKGVKAIRQIISDAPGVKFLAISNHSNRQFVDAMIKAGARGYLFKDHAYEELVRAIQTVVDDRIYLCLGIEKNVATTSG